jgi:CubicO group peptidase (beta-lactamase class C family)
MFSKNYILGSRLLLLMLIAVALLLTQPAAGASGTAQLDTNSAASTLFETSDARALDNPAELETFLDDYLAEQMAEHHIPGAVITVVKDGQVFLSKGYGYADLDSQTPFDPEQTK